MEQMIPSTLPNGMTGMRVAPKMDPRAYRSFEVHSPVSTHYRDASCAEVQCANHLNGWTSTIDTGTQQGTVWAYAIKRSGRRYTAQVTGTVVTFAFPAGQTCFKAPHKVPTGRPEIFVVRDGDWRGNPTGHVHRGVRPPEFVERMGENLQVLADGIQRG
jgi:hypothetical protein